MNEEINNIEVTEQQPLPEGEQKLVLRTEGLVKRYGKRTVVNDVSFDVKQGEIVGLLGPNGAGKTTSFYMTTGLIVPNGGHIWLGDQEVTKFPVYKRARAGIGYLAQEASVFRKMSVEDNILSVFAAFQGLCAVAAVFCLYHLAVAKVYQRPQLWIHAQYNVAAAAAISAVRPALGYIFSPVQMHGISSSFSTFSTIFSIS